MSSGSNSNKLKINLYGESYAVKKIELKSDDFEHFSSIAKKLNQPLHSALIDPFFYHSLKKSNIQCIEDLESTHWEGLVNNQKNQIEIWFKNKKIQKLNINSLQEELLLFPLFNTLKTPALDISRPGIFVEQIEIGLIGSYEIKITNFNFDNLVFEIADFQNAICLCNMKYNDIPFIKKRKDSLITYQNGFQIMDMQIKNGY